MKIYDIIIIGAGPAGLTAGIYAAREGLKTAIISKDIGGTTNKILMLENWPGFTGPGAQLMKQFYDQLKKYDVDFIMEDTQKISKQKNLFNIQTKKQKLTSKTLILATGTERKQLNIKGEKELIGKGISYCVTCDAFFFKGKDVAVIGGSDCAATSAIALTDIAKKVYVIYRGEKLRCEEINIKRLEEKNNSEIFYNSVPLEIIGKNKVEGLVIKKDGGKQEIKVEGIFIEIGSTPLTQLTKNLKLKLDKEGHVIVDSNMNTNVEGFFAAGDVTNHPLKQVVVASAQGAIAAKSASHLIKQIK